jgi:hypothetical protein
MGQYLGQEEGKLGGTGVGLNKLNLMERDLRLVTTKNGVRDPDESARPDLLFAGVTFCRITPANAKTTGYLLYLIADMPCAKPYQEGCEKVVPKGSSCAELA